MHLIDKIFSKTIFSVFITETNEPSACGIGDLADLVTDTSLIETTDRTSVEGETSTPLHEHSDIVGTGIVYIECHISNRLLKIIFAIVFSISNGCSS